MKLVSKAKQLGIGLLELMLSLAIIAILLVMAIRYYQSASNSQSINQAIDMVNAVKAGVKNYLTSNMGSTSIPSVGDLATQGYLPNIYASPTTANPWGGAVGVTDTEGSCSGTSKATMNPTFIVCLAGVPPDICTQVKTRLQNTLNKGESADCSDSGVLSVTVGT